MGNATESDAFARAEAVFLGEVVDYEPPPSREMMSSADPATWTFLVSEVYKGRVSSTQEIVSEVSGASCGLEIPRQGEFLVFAGERFDLPVGEDQLYAGLCGGTRSIDRGPLAVDVASYPPRETNAAPPSVPTSTAPASSDKVSDAGAVRVAIAAAALAASGALATLGAERRRRGRSASIIGR